MYIDKLRIRNLRTFRDSTLQFIHPGTDFKALDMPKPKLPNVNLLLGDNGSGKTSVLKSMAMAALGPAIPDANLPIYRLVRRSSGAPAKHKTPEAFVDASFTLHEQDTLVGKATAGLSGETRILRKGEVERVQWSGKNEEAWESIFSTENESFFFVGYGATRRVESRERVDMGARQVTSFERAQRVRSLFEEAYSLVPLSYWLPQVNEGRFAETRNIINRLLEKTGYQFDGKMEQGEYLFRSGGSKVPFPALSDGYRAYLGWIGDLLYHVNRTCPSGKQLKENKGIVMVDEIDLHLHPTWQMSVLPRLAGVLKNIQFIVTSHSPWVVGSLEWMNILKMERLPGKATRAERIREAVHGLDADQVLVTKFFNMSSTRVGVKETRMKELSQKANTGDRKAAELLVHEWSKGLEKMKA